MQTKTIPILVVFILLLTACSSVGKSTQTPLIHLYSDETEQIPPQNNHHTDSIKVAIASVVSPSASLSKYDLLLKHLEKSLDRPIEVIQKQTYKEVNEMLANGEVDFAFICSLSYVLGVRDDEMVGIAAPEVYGGPFYRSYVITKKDSSYQSIEDFRGKRFAFTDPFSYTGRLAVLAMLEENGENAETFFGKTYYTYSHDYSIKAVAMGVVDGAAVDGLLFEQLREINSELISQLKIVEFGDDAGTPPIVASKKTDKKLVEQFKKWIVNLQNDQEGKTILKEIGINRYVPIDDDNYRVIKDSLHLLGDDG